MKRIYLVTERKAQGFTQVTLAKRVGCDQKTISRLETQSGVTPTFDVQYEIGKVLGVDPAALKFGPDPRVEQKPKRASHAA